MGAGLNSKRIYIAGAVALVLAGIFAMYFNRFENPGIGDSLNYDTRIPGQTVDLSPTSIDGDERKSVDPEPQEINYEEQQQSAQAAEYQSAMLGDIPMDEYILRHLELAESGSAESAYYVAEAMKYCAGDMLAFDLSVAKYVTQNAGIVFSPERSAAQIMDSLVGLPEFYRGEVKRRMGRAIDCRKLGWTPEYLNNEGVGWSGTAEERGQVIAVARSAGLYPLGSEFDDQRIEESKNTMRQLLKVTKDQQVLLHAASVVAVSTNRDVNNERLAWALLACEYSDCETLSYFYRNTCEYMSLNGSDICTDDLTDKTYLFRKFPSTYDAASARAKELKAVLAEENWYAIGLN